MNNHNKVHDVVIIGAGPIGIAAAAHLLERGLQPIILEKGDSVGRAMQEWGHVRLFTNWSFVIDTAVASILAKHDWKRPCDDQIPTGKDIVEQYLIPASKTPEYQGILTYNAEVIAIAKADHSKHTSKNRDVMDFTLHYKDQDDEVHIIKADAVIDASGTWSSPNPIGLDGLPVPGEIKNRDVITYGIPDILDKHCQDYKDNRVLLVGGGHSAMNVGLNLIKLQENHPTTKIYWGLRSDNLDKLLGGGINDKVPARRELGLAAKNAIESGKLELLANLKVRSISQTDSGLSVKLETTQGEQEIIVDRIIVSTGFRPNIGMLSELRLDIDEVVEAPRGLAGMVDPNAHQCGSVPGHGAIELAHIDKNFYIVGMKSYGRAPSFLMLHGYEQVRSIAAELAGDHEAAKAMRLTLPDGSSGSCGI